MDNREVKATVDTPSELSFRRLERSDFPFLQRWLAAPHVTVWWNEPFDLSALEAKCGPGIDGLEPVYVFVVHCASTPIGWIQWYRWRDFPEHAAQLRAEATSAGIDIAIGEVAMTGRGLGPEVIRTFCITYIFANLDVTAIVADPATANVRSLRAFRKAGFRIVGTSRLAGEAADRSVVRFERPQAQRE